MISQFLPPSRSPLLRLKGRSHDAAVCALNGKVLMALLPGSRPPLAHGAGRARGATRFGHANLPRGFEPGEPSRLQLG